MVKINFRGFDIEVNDENLITINNINAGKCNISFYNPILNFWGFNVYDINDNMWVKTNPTKWDFGKINEKGEVHIIITFQNKILKIKYDFLNRHFEDITDENLIVVNGEVIKKNISVLIPAYDTVKYIDETLNKFNEICEKYDYLDVEIIVGIDGCLETFKHISKKVYPENVKILLSEKNYGEPIMKNSLIQICKNEKFIVFDSDDIPTDEMINVLWNELNNYRFVFYPSYNFNDGDDITGKEKISKNVWGGCFAGLKSDFLNLNGWFPWRVSADDEFQKRVGNKEIKHLNMDKPLFYYRIRGNSSSRDGLTNEKSFIRRCYLDLMTEKIAKNKFDNPNRFYFNKNLLYIQ